MLTSKFYDYPYFTFIWKKFFALTCTSKVVGGGLDFLHGKQYTYVAVAGEWRLTFVEGVCNEN